MRSGRGNKGSDRAGGSTGDRARPPRAGDRAGRDERPPRGGARASRDERPARGAPRGGRDERPARGAPRGGRDERPARGAPRGGRDERPARGARDERPVRGARDERAPRGGRDERPVRGTPRGSRDERPARAERAPARERGAPARPQRAERPDRPSTAGRFVYGVNPVLEALRARPEEIDALYLTEGEVSRNASAEIFSRARDAGIRVNKVPRERLSNMSEGGVHQGVVIELVEFTYVDPLDILQIAEDRGEPPLLVVLDGIQDPHNLGAIIRSAHALGAHGLIIPKDRAASVTGLVSKTSAGAVEHMPIARVTNVSRTLEELKLKGVWTAAADPEGEQTLWEARLDGPMAIIVGSEGPGVRPGVLAHCDLKVRIPLVGQVASLNASVAAGMFLYECARQRALSSAKTPSEAPHPVD